MSMLNSARLVNTTLGRSGWPRKAMRPKVSTENSSWVLAQK
jgi:hypothetical protein